MIFGNFFDHIKFGATAWLDRWNDFFGTGVLNLQSSGPVGSTGDFALSYPSTPNLTATVGVGTAWVAGYRVHNDNATPVTLTFAAADPTNPRIDLIQVGPIPISSVNIPAGLTQNLGQITVKTGTPAGSPVQPTPDTNMVPLFAVAVAANQTTIGTANITDLRVAVPFHGTFAMPSNVLLNTGGTMASGTITNIPTPVNPTDTANKAYVDAHASGIAPKAEAQLATTANITLSGEQTIDGVLTSASRVLVANQTDQTTNGIYVSGSGAWTRSSDANTGALLVGAYVFVLQGTANAGTYWYQQTPATITIGTSSIIWVEEAQVTGFLPLAGGSLSGALNEAQGTNIASAATTNIAAATGNFVQVTGTTTITALGTAQAGTRRVVQFTGALTLTYNATSLILPGAANITTAANDVATFVSLGSGHWICANYARASGQALILPTVAGLCGTAYSGLISGGSPVTLTVSFTAPGPGVLCAISISDLGTASGAENAYLYINNVLLDTCYQQTSYGLAATATTTGGTCTAKFQTSNSISTNRLIFWFIPTL